MSSKKTTDQTIKFDQGSKNAFDTLQPGIQSSLSADMNLDPTKSSVYNLMLQKSLEQARSLQQMGVNRVAANQAASGFSPNSAYLQSRNNQLGRFNSGLTANAFIQNLMSADERRRQATAMGMGYKPLTTGQNTVQTTSGLGTWLPQVISAGAALGLAPFTGGASLAGLGGAMKGGTSYEPTPDINALAGTSQANPFQSSWFQQASAPAPVAYGGGTDWSKVTF